MTRPRATLTHEGRRFRWRAGRPQVFGGLTWADASPGYLARVYPADSPVWAWLASHGLERPPSPGGPSGTAIPEADRVRPVLSVRVSRAAVAALGVLVSRWGCSRGEAVERAIEEARKS